MPTDWGSENRPFEQPERTGLEPVRLREPYREPSRGGSQYYSQSYGTHPDATDGLTGTYSIADTAPEPWLLTKAYR